VRPVKAVRGDEHFLSLAQIDKLCRDLKVKYACKACALGFLLAEIRMHKPCCCLNLLISWCMAHV